VQKFHRFLIVRTDRIGDVILTLPMASVIRKNIPHAFITMLIQKYTKELVESDRNVNEIISYDQEGTGAPFFDLIENIRLGNYDVVFHTHPRFRLALITWLAGIPVRVGTGYRWYSFLFNRKVFEHRKDARFHELIYNVHLIEALGYTVKGIDVSPAIEVMPETEKRVMEYMENLGLSKDKKTVILHPGSGKSARDWSPKSFGLLGKKLSEIEGVQIIVTGSKNEKALIELVRSFIGRQAFALPDQLSISELAAFIKNSSLFVANSTGPIHIAAAVGTPLIGFYPHITSLSANRWGPWTDKKIIFSPNGKPLNCKKCIRKKTATCECMDTISVDQVYTAAFQLIRQS
jgi:lipopolysaccharide heptosyltransferase III